jgi:signal peptidase II
VVAAVVVAADQLAKTWALRVLADRTIDLVGSLRLRLVFNTGSAFSIGSGLGPVLVVVGVVIVAVLLRASRDLDSTPALVGLGLVLGGAVGNLLDRIVRGGDGLFNGAVVDFVDLQWWPVFNVADMAICAGVAVLAVTLGRAGSGDDAGGEPGEAARRGPGAMGASGSADPRGSAVGGAGPSAVGGGGSAERPGADAGER